jgi:hypothetical protein
MIALMLYWRQLINCVFLAFRFRFRHAHIRSYHQNYSYLNCYLSSQGHSFFVCFQRSGQYNVTYIHIPGYGWWYAVTVIDYYGRYLLAAELTYSYSSREVIKAVDLARSEAERLCGKLDRVPFLVTDNGPSFISRRFVSHLKNMFRHVRIQYRTPSQLGLLERFHRTLKEEEVYWRMYDNPGHCRQCLSEFGNRYNNKRPHWSLIPVEGGDPLTPYDVYVEGRKTQIPKWQGWAKAARKKLDQMMEAAA